MGRPSLSMLQDHSKTLGLIVDECFSFSAINYYFHNPSNESITLNPTKLSNKVLRNCEGVVLSSLNLPSLKLNNLNTQVASPITLEFPRLKTQLLEDTRNFIRFLENSRNEVNIE